MCVPASPRGELVHSWYLLLYSYLSLQNSLVPFTGFLSRDRELFQAFAVEWVITEGHHVSV